MENLIKYFKALQREKQSLKISIEYNKICDWYVWIYHEDSKTLIFDEEGTSLTLLSNKAILELKNWAEGYEELEDIFYNIFN